MDGIYRIIETKKTEWPNIKADEEVCTSSPKKLRECILDYDGSSCGNFTLLSNLKNPQEGLQHCIDIRDRMWSKSTGTRQRKSIGMQINTK